MERLIRILLIFGVLVVSALLAFFAIFLITKAFTIILSTFGTNGVYFSILLAFLFGFAILIESDI